MIQRASLTTRAFLFSFVPVCLVLGASFLALGAAVERQVKKELLESLEGSQKLVARTNAEWAARVQQFVSVLADSAGLKAAIGLLHEAPSTPELASQVRATIEAQLGEMHQVLGYDVLVITDWKGNTVAAVQYRNGQSSTPEKLTAVPDKPQLIDVDGVLYEFTSTPISLGGDQTGNLSLGSEFNLNRYQMTGDAALLDQGKIILSTFPAAERSALETQLSGRCGQFEADCEIERNGETFVVMPVKEASLGPGYRLLEFRSLDGAVREFRQSWLRVLLRVSIGGIVLALLFTLATSRSVAKPLREVVSQLQVAEKSGQLPERITTSQAAEELRVLTDVFNRVALAERRSRNDLEKAKTIAEAANQAKGEFLANISHELRTPMNGVIAMTELLLETGLDEEQIQYASTVRDSGQSLLVIINDILDFSRLDAGKMVLDPAPFNLKRTIEDVLDLLLPQANGKGLRLTLEYPQDAPCRLIGDSGRVRQVFTNLVGNAIKFTESGAIVVRVDCMESTSQDALMYASVQDSGIGIPADKLEVIFQKFTQADGSLTRRHGGTGLGLAIVKHLVELMGGTVGVDSRLGEGSKFWVALRLPLDLRTERALQPAGSAQEVTL